MSLSTDVTRTVPHPNGTADVAALLGEVRRTLARVVHDVNNPLAIISGNAQFLAELVRAAELDPDFAKAVSDIEEASRQLADRIAQLASLKEHVLALLDETHDGL